MLKYIIKKKKKKQRSTGNKNATGDSKVVCETGLVFSQIALWDCLVGRFPSFLHNLEQPVKEAMAYPKQSRNV